MIPATRGVRRFADAGVGEDAVGLIRHLSVEQFDGRNASLGTNVQDCPGRELRAFVTFAEGLRPGE